MLQSEHLSWDVLVDFDGSIAPDDPTDRILANFADPLWRNLELAWQEGRISSRQCMQRQVELLRVSPEMLDEQINSIRIDPGFSAFLDFCEAAGGRVSIVSVGLDRIITGALGNLGRTLPIFANKLEWQGGDRWRLALPWLRCRRCKLQMLTRATVLPGSRYCR